LCPLKARAGNFLPQVLHCFQYASLASVTVVKNAFQNLCEAREFSFVIALFQKAKGNFLPFLSFNGSGDILL